MGRKYVFDWSLLGNLEEGRPNLGPTTRVEVYRLMQFCLRDVLEGTYGTEAADKLFYQAGYLAGQHLFRQFLQGCRELPEFVSKLQNLLKDLNIGVLRLEEADLEKQRFILTVSEDLDCSGLPELEYEICVYDEGVIAAFFDEFTGKKFTAKEVDCWCTGDRTCRFRVEAQTVASA